MNHASSTPSGSPRTTTADAADAEAVLPPTQPSPEPMTMAVAVQPDRTLPGMWQVGLEGEIDLEAAPLLRERLLELADGGAVAVIVDLSRVSFLDSSGLSVLIESAQRMEQHGGALYLEGARGAVRQVLEITALLERYKHPDS